MKKPICFVAMAFGREDTDLFYEEQILPVLKRNGVKAIIINRQQSNDDLNVQIIKQLEKADFCIADLTYTRPSVYFEAGYAQRLIPVIYTVRRDHLGKGQPEDLRVHFDLQMKPIIDWRSPDEKSFANRLEKRLRATVLKDWNRKQKEDTKYKVAIKQFQQLPQYEKLYRIRRLALYEMREVGITLSQWEKVGYSFVKDSSSHTGAIRKKSITNGYVDHVFGSIKTKNKIVEVTLNTYDSLYKKDLWDLQGAYHDGVFRNKLTDKYKKSTLLLHNIVLCLRPVPSSKIESVLVSFSPIINSKRYMRKFSERNFEELETPQRTIVNTFHFLSGIDSEYSLKKSLKELIDNYILEQLKQKI